MDESLSQAALTVITTSPVMGPINGWHKGERAIQHKMGYDSVMSEAWTWITPEMAEEDRALYTSRLPFIPVTTIDDRRRPWSSILAGPDGKPGFATSQHLGELTLNAHIWEGDPFPQNIEATSKDGPALIAGIGVDFSTRRRAKFAGHIASVENDGGVLRIRSVVNEAIGNCPKYINARELVPTLDRHPQVVHRRLYLARDERLSDDVISFIHSADTLFLGTCFDASKDGEDISSHVGMNHRGGCPGFARIRPLDGRTVVIPDYSGNRLLTSLGNIEATSLAGVTFVSFTTGAILYLTGEAHNIVGPAAQQLMPRTNALTTIHVTGYIFVEDALPLREKLETQVQCSPYSPPIRLLSEEVTSQYFKSDVGATPMVTLTRIEVHSQDIVTFSFESPTHVAIVPGQAAILDFKPFVGALPYQHMAPANPAGVNDDRIRTWTVSGSSRWAWLPLPGRPDADASTGPVSLRLTMRRKPQGVVTGALFAMAYQIGRFRSELLEDARPLQLTIPLLGITGDFTLPAEADETCTSLAETSAPPAGSRKWLWVAGGIGVTPFLAMLAGLQERRGQDECSARDDIVLVLATREPDVLLALVGRALDCSGDRLQDTAETEGQKIALLIHIFSRQPPSSSSCLKPVGQESAFTVEVTWHDGRVSKDAFRALNIEDMTERRAYICGPECFERVVLDALKEMGVNSEQIKREGFAY